MAGLWFKLMCPVIMLTNSFTFCPICLFVKMVLSLLPRPAFPDVRRGLLHGLDAYVVSSKVNLSAQRFHDRVQKTRNGRLHHSPGHHESIFNEDEHLIHPHLLLPCQIHQQLGGSILKVIPKPRACQKPDPSS